jgi:hypothetical protein
MMEDVVLIPHGMYASSYDARPCLTDDFKEADGAYVVHHRVITLLGGRAQYVVTPPFWDVSVIVKMK